jgi:hypothetical protein
MIRFKFKGKNKIFVIICFIIIIMLFIFILLKSLKSPVWINFYEHEKYKGFFDDKIKEISLQKSFNTKVTFSDEDLIEKWEKFFRTLQICKEQRKSIFNPKMVGGGEYVTVVTEKSNYLFTFMISPGKKGLKLEVGNYYYGFISSEENPFEDIYNIAKERYGEINLWE